MVKQSKYQDFRVYNTVYVSSTGHYSFRVSFTENGKKTGRDYDYGLYYPLRRNYPRYVTSAVELEIAKLLKSGEAKFYEVDRDGNRRYEGLRYHMPELIPSMIKSLEQKP